MLKVLLPCSTFRERRKETESWRLGSPRHKQGFPRPSRILVLPRCHFHGLVCTPSSSSQPPPHPRRFACPSRLLFISVVSATHDVKVQVLLRALRSERHPPPPAGAPVRLVHLLSLLRPLFFPPTPGGGGGGRGGGGSAHTPRGNDENEAPEFAQDNAARK